MNNQKRASYTGLRSDIISMIIGKPINVLDVGCSNGVLLQYARDQLGAIHTMGIEFDEGLAQEAVKKADIIVKVNLDHLEVEDLGVTKFDLIVLADVLEHTKEPALVMLKVLTAATTEAQVIISLPNIQHWTAIQNLIMGRWPMRERGLFDRTHLRFFTLQSIIDLADQVGLRVESKRRNLRIFDNPDSSINRLARFLGFWPLAPYFTYQYVLRLRRI